MFSFLVNEEIKNQRKSICDTCEYKKTVASIEYCGLCKCAILMKVVTKAAICPENKWPQITEMKE